MVLYVFQSKNPEWNQSVRPVNLLQLVICVLASQGEAFVVWLPRGRRRKCFRRLKRCSRRRSKSGIKADVIKTLDMNHVSTILVGDQFYKCQFLFKKSQGRFIVFCLSLLQQIPF